MEQKINRLKKVVIIGPESTGKSTLCQQLANHYKTIWIKEYAREYLLTNGTDYTFDNLLTIAQGQITREDVATQNLINNMDGNQLGTSQIDPGWWGHQAGRAAVVCVPTDHNNQTTATTDRHQIGNAPNQSPIIFIDTDMYVMKVWCEFVFDKCHHWILNTIVDRHYDLYLLCNVDLAWVKDELREYPDLANREKLYHHYKDIMVNQQVPWIDIKGNYEARLQKAIEAVNKIL